jgi:hypothetical protein
VCVGAGGEGGSLECESLCINKYLTVSSHDRELLQ